MFQKLFFYSLTLFCMGHSHSSLADETISPMPIPKHLRIEGATPREKVWNRLTQKQKQFAYHLLLAGLEGKKLLAHQIHRHSNAIRTFIFDSVSQKQIKTTQQTLGEEGFLEFLTYSAKFLDQAGPYASSNRKYLLKKNSAEKIAQLISQVAPSWTDGMKSDVVKLMTDPSFEVQLYPENQEGNGLETTGGNLYERPITGKEVKEVLDKSLKINLNCRVVKLKNNLNCEIQNTQTPGLVGETLTKIVGHLRNALPLASTKLQKEQIQKTIEYFEKGNIEDFRAANIAWVKDGSKSPVDMMIGWVEVYEDWLARIGTWETYVQIVDPVVSKQAQALATHAQHFENNMPYGTFKKTFPKNYAPPALMVYYFQERGSYRTGGYNLPNFDDIRRDVGAKNIIRLPLPGETEDPGFKAMWIEALSEYAPATKVETLLKDRETIWKVLVLLHEIIGHGSGTYDVTKFGKNEDPISALGPLGSALEEQRADLTALVFGGDQKLVDVGVYKNMKEAKRILHGMYDFYLVDFLRRTSGQRTFTEAHQRGHWLYIKKLWEADAIGWVSKKGAPQHTPEDGILIVKDYDKFYEVSKALLGELQTIKATRNEEALKKLFEKYAPLDEIQSDWAQAIIKRGENLKINSGYVEQPWKVTPNLKFQAMGGTTLDSVAPFWHEAF
jgi:dipeptidyl-peptidase-3